MFIEFVRVPKRDKYTDHAGLLSMRFTPLGRPAPFNTQVTCIGPRQVTSKSYALQWRVSLKRNPSLIKTLLRLRALERLWTRCLSVYKSQHLPPRIDGNQKRSGARIGIPTFFLDHSSEYAVIFLVQLYLPKPADRIGMDTVTAALHCCLDWTQVDGWSQKREPLSIDQAP